jgi:HSP20 family protein
MATQPQTIPVRVYNGDQHIILAAPLPGLEPEDISITVTPTGVTIMGEERGPRQHERDLIVEEWTFGPYYRQIALPELVDGSLTNATYGNGVLVVSMPKRKESGAASGANFQLHPISATHGERVGHVGSGIHPKKSSEHEKKHRAETKAWQEKTPAHNHMGGAMPSRFD